MKRVDMDRMLWLLAGSGWSDATISSVLEELQLWGPERVIAELRRIRKGTSGKVGASEPKTKKDEQSSAVQRAAQLLRDVQGKTAAEAAQSMANSIRLGNPGTVVPAFREKVGLPQWLSEVASEIGPSEMLHHATVAHNELSRAKPSAWALKDPDGE